MSPHPAIRVVLGPLVAGSFLGLVAGCSGGVTPPAGDGGGSSSVPSPPPPAPTAAPPVDNAPTTVDVSGGTGRAYFDDIRYSTRLGRVVVAPGTGHVVTVDPQTLAVSTHDAPSAEAQSADEGRGMLFAADASTVVAVQASTGKKIGQVGVAARADYIRWSEATSEVWVTEPGTKGIEIFSVEVDESPPVRAGRVELPGPPEGLAFDASRGRAYVHLSGSLGAIDVKTRALVDRWDIGCSYVHGIPVVDEARGLVFAGCASAEMVVVDVAHGGRVTGRHPIKDGGASILAYSPSLHHAYLRGDPGKEVDVLDVLPDGSLKLLGTFTATEEGHCMTADDHGNVWVCDATKGALLRFRDPF